MRTIGLLGGMSWESSVEYYRIINEAVRDELGGTHSAKSVMYSVDFHEIEDLQHRGEWDRATELMIEGARAVVAAGGECLVICTNTMHLMADAIQAAIDVPLIHIADATAAAVNAAGIASVALLGTRFTMEEDFYRGRLEQRHNLAISIPDEIQRNLIHTVIYDELVRGVIVDESRAAFVEIIEDLVASGAEGVIAGCTEIELLVSADDVAVPYFPTTRIHALAAVDWALHP